MKRNRKGELLHTYNCEVYAYNNALHRRKMFIIMTYIAYLENENLISNR